MNTTQLPTTDYRLPKYEADKRARSRWNKTKRKAKKRYGAICTRCKSVKHIEYHHLNDRHHHPKQAYTIKNIRPLCRDCHRISKTSIHILCGGTQNKTTKSDFYKWLEL